MIEIATAKMTLGLLVLKLVYLGEPIRDNIMSCVTRDPFV